MTDWIRTNKMYVLIGVIMMLSLGIYYFFPLESGNSKNSIENDWSETEEKTGEANVEKENEVESISNPLQAKIFVDVKGAVTSPGVYEASIGERVIDIIERAGGLLDSADKNNINFAMKVVDEMVLYIPVVGEQNSSLSWCSDGWFIYKKEQLQMERSILIQLLNRIYKHYQELVLQKHWPLLNTVIPMVLLKVLKI